MCRAVVTFTLIYLARTTKKVKSQGDGIMLNSFKGLLADWKQTRSITLEFISQLSDADFDKQLPRKELNTIRLQLEELAAMQEDWQAAMSTKTMDFSESYALMDTSRQGLAAKFAELDHQLETLLASLDGSEVIDWYGNEKSIYEHFSSMISHEMMHIGQIIAFCYATGIHIPGVITEEMALQG